MIFRIDVSTTPTARNGGPAVDPAGESLRAQIAELGIRVGQITASRIFLIDSDSTRSDMESSAVSLLSDPVAETARLIEAPNSSDTRDRIEIHLKPGVMDPVAASTEAALRDLGLQVKQVRTGRAFVFNDPMDRGQLQTIASRILANGVIESVHFDSYVPRQFESGRDYLFELKHIDLIKLDDTQLIRLSREGHLFLSLAEMKAAQLYFRELGANPRTSNWKRSLRPGASIAFIKHLRARLMWRCMTRREMWSGIVTMTT